MTASTTSERAAGVRRLRAAAARHARTRTPDRDPCPHCATELARPQGTTRRLAVLTRAPGVFAWQCPDCAGTWTEPSGHRPG